MIIVVYLEIIIYMYFNGGVTLVRLATECIKPLYQLTKNGASGEIRTHNLFRASVSKTEMYTSSNTEAFNSTVYWIQTNKHIKNGEGSRHRTYTEQKAPNASKANMSTNSIIPSFIKLQMLL